MTSFLYDVAAERIGLGIEEQWRRQDVYVMLLDGSYQPSPGHRRILEDVVPFEIRTYGYRSGGTMLHGRTVSRAVDGSLLFQAAPAIWDRMCGNYRYAVVYLDLGLGVPRGAQATLFACYDHGDRHIDGPLRFAPPGDVYVRCANSHAVDAELEGLLVG